MHVMHVSHQRPSAMQQLHSPLLALVVHRFDCHIVCHSLTFKSSAWERMTNTFPQSLEMCCVVGGEGGLSAEPGCADRLG